MATRITRSTGQNTSAPPMHQNPDPESPLTENPSIPDPESPLTENTSTPRAPTPSADPGDVSREGLFPIAKEPEEPEDRPEQTLAKSLELLNFLHARSDQCLIVSR